MITFLTLWSMTNILATAYNVWFSTKLSTAAFENLQIRRSLRQREAYGWEVDRNFEKEDDND